MQVKEGFAGGPYFVRNILLVGFLDHRIFIKYITNQLGRYPNLDLATIDSLRTGVYYLTRLALFLAFRRSLGKKQMLSVTRSSKKTAAQDKKQKSTSRPSQNSASEMCPDMTSSLCSAARSGLPNSTFLRSRKSLAWSPPVTTGVPIRSLATDGARDVDDRDGGTESFGVGALAERLAVGAGTTTAVVAGATLGLAVTGGRETVSDTLRLRLMMVVRSFLNFSRSAYATGWGERKVKLCPASSPLRPSLRRTCAAPSLLQKSAGQTSELSTGDGRRMATNRGNHCKERVRKGFFSCLGSIASECLKAQERPTIFCRKPLPYTTR
jgi:hypothetical protein